MFAHRTATAERHHVWIDAAKHKVYKAPIIVFSMTYIIVQ